MVMRLLLCTLVVLCLVDISRVRAGRFIVHTKAGKSFILDTEAGAREGQSGEDYRLVGRYLVSALTALLFRRNFRRQKFIRRKSGGRRRVCLFVCKTLSN